ncbi:iron permease [Bradyrhizobium sp. KBS0727]|uniref:FTR1 family iron permease n=1 Tax=unclassified Bradyrhizobium TaxID=2631580 RepID=UPI00110EAF32|nr:MULTISPECIES: FTR1 family protein [unclassified Bradyrhizobium]QDW39557.1 iron permease [Bradyrhizobium sp. KBS0725]QDW46160.1 iron permease [Bradyrhizobium sp. KBS0727]
MIAALIIVFREVFEAGLIIGIVLAVTRTVPHRNAWIGGGVLAGVLAACVVAAFAGALSNLFAGMGQELFNAAILVIAVVMLTWHNVWMARHGAELAGELRVAGQAVVEGSKSLLALAVVVGVAVLREGSEVVLFLYGVIATGGDTAWGVTLGGLGGLALGLMICLLTYFGLLRIPARALFTTTTILIALLAAGMAAQAAAFLEKANWLTAMDNVVWDSGWLLSDASIPGKALHTLIGYTDQPTAMQLTVYLAILLITFVLMRLYGAPAKAVVPARG